jgi:hypothetical protein
MLPVVIVVTDLVPCSMASKTMRVITRDNVVIVVHASTVERSKVLRDVHGVSDRLVPVGCSARTWIAWAVEDPRSIWSPDLLREVVRV